MRNSPLERLARVSPLVVLLCVAVPSAGIAVAASASDTSDVAAVESVDVSSRSIDAIRRATRRFSDFEAARKEGWSVELTPCMESDDGGMGFHFGRASLLEDEGALDPMTPEALLYVPARDGSMEFLGIEYILPFADWQGSEPPVFLDQEMVPNEAFGIWTLHLWFRDNPNGVFAGWNPEVGCEHADAVTRH